MRVLRCGAGGRPALLPELRRRERGRAGPDVRELLAAGTVVAAAPAITATVPGRGAPGRLALIPGWDVSLQLAVAVFAFVLGIGAWAGARTTSGGAGGSADRRSRRASAAGDHGPLGRPAGVVGDDRHGRVRSHRCRRPSGRHRSLSRSVDRRAGRAASGSGDSTSSTDTDPRAAGRPTPSTGDGSTGDTPATPPLKHVWVISLADQGYDTLFDPAGGAPYLAKDLAAKGTVLSHYYGVTTGGLANGVALVSGEGPNAATQSRCPSVSDVDPGHRRRRRPGRQGPAASTRPTSSRSPICSASASGHGTRTRARSTATRRCPKPVTGAAFPAPRIPFLAFHTIIDDATCADRVTGVSPLATDLAAAKTTPALSYIVPGPCEDGSPTPCAPGTAAGLPPADAFLKRVVPPILASPAVRATHGAHRDPRRRGAPGRRRRGHERLLREAAVAGGRPDDAGGGRTGALVLSPLAGRRQLRQHPGSITTTC